MSKPNNVEIEAIGKGFRDLTYPAANYHHREHLIATVYLLKTSPERDWHVEFPEMIKRYNIAQGGTNSDTSGYHHTITIFYLNLVMHIMARKPESNLEQACAAVLDSPASDKNLMLRFYTRERLFSSSARKQWIDPDLAEPDFEELLRCASIEIGR